MRKKARMEMKRFGGLALVLLAGVVLYTGCDFSTVKQRVITNLIDASFVLHKQEMKYLLFGFLDKDTAKGYFSVSDTLRIDFSVQDTQSFRLYPYDSAHSILHVSGTSLDSLMLGLATSDTLAFGFVNRDTGATRTVLFHLDRIYWQNK
jgi:hypothetical protein